VSGPLRDRIDLWITMDRVPPAALIGGAEPESSATVARRIAHARQVQRSRQRGVENARVHGRELRRLCAMGRETTARAIMLAEREGLSGRGTDRLLRVARTIADLADEQVVTQACLDEAARFRAPVDQLAMARAG